MNKQRLIDANELERRFTAIAVAQSNNKIRLVKAICEIRDAPTVDAVPVVHGYWHIDDYDGGEPDGYAAFVEVHCSKCGYELGAESGQYGWAYGDPFPLNYCPNCGAKMDGERRSDDA